MELNIIWFVLIVVLFSGYVVLDGFDLGVGMIHKKAKSDDERRQMLNSIAPVWDGNEVWLVTAGGALFAAFPDVYATVFSGFYNAFMLFLLMLIGRAVSIEFRSKIESKTWRGIWDTVFNVSSYLIALLLGVSLGNIVSGVPVAADKEFAGSFFGLLHPYAIFLGLTAVAALRMHGRFYAAFKIGGDLYERIVSNIKLPVFLFLGFYVILTIWTHAAYPHMTQNFYEYPIWFIVPALVVAAFIYIFIAIKNEAWFKGFIASSAIIALSITNVAIGIFPALLISAPNPENSLTIFNASSSAMTLSNMLIIAAIGVPLVLVYTFVINKTFRGKVKLDSSSY